MHEKLPCSCFSASPVISLFLSRNCQATAMATVCPHQQAVARSGQTEDPSAGRKAMDAKFEGENKIYITCVDDLRCMGTLIVWLTWLTWGDYLCMRLLTVRDLFNALLYLPVLLPNMLSCA